MGPTGPFFPSCLPGTLLNTATYAQALSHVASLKGKVGRGRGGVGREGGDCLASLLSLLSKLLLLPVTAGSQAPPTCCPVRFQTARVQVDVTQFHLKPTQSFS